MTRIAPQERVLIFLPMAKDGALVGEAQAHDGIGYAICATPADVLREYEHGAGALLLVEEALGDGDGWLVRLVDEQPPWSDLPVLLLTRHGGDLPAASGAMASLGNVTLLERPLRIYALISSVRSALRARMRQIQTRAHLVEREIAGERKGGDRGQRQRRWLVG